MENKKYIEMVLALPEEFFKDWEWNVGDLAITYTGSEILLITDPLIQQFGYPNRIEAMRFSKIKSYEILYMEDLRPIPNQKQLQQMLIDYENKDNIYWKSNDFSISERFIAVVVEGDLVNDIENKTLDEMWLEFVMYLIFEKVWDGGKWSVLP